jgi:hypothetical protein
VRAFFQCKLRPGSRTSLVRHFRWRRLQHHQSSPSRAQPGHSTRTPRSAENGKIIMSHPSMDLHSQQRPPAPENVPQTQLPSIASLTSGAALPEQSPAHLRQYSDTRESRDSGNWSISQTQSKREFDNYFFRVLLILDFRKVDGTFISIKLTVYRQTLQVFPTPWACTSNPF